MANSEKGFFARSFSRESKQLTLSSITFGLQMIDKVANEGQEEDKKATLTITIEVRPPINDFYGLVQVVSIRGFEKHLLLQGH